MREMEPAPFRHFVVTVIYIINKFVTRKESDTRISDAGVYTLNRRVLILQRGMSWKAMPNTRAKLTKACTWQYEGMEETNNDMLAKS